MLRGEVTFTGTEREVCSSKEGIEVFLLDAVIKSHRVGTACSGKGDLGRGVLLKERAL